MLFVILADATVTAATSHIGNSAWPIPEACGLQQQHLQALCMPRVPQQSQLTRIIFQVNHAMTLFQLEFETSSEIPV